MARKTEKEKKNAALSRSIQKNLDSMKKILNQLSISTYGTDMEDESENLNDRFNAIMKNEVDRITANGTNTFDSFLGQLYNSDRKSQNAMDFISTNQLQINGNGYVNPQDFITDKYRNLMLKQADANEISNQLIELREAKEIMRDAILSADVNTGRISRQIIFENCTVANAEKDYMRLIEVMEKKRDVQRKIKDFIVDNALGYGSFYTYTIPYYEVFNNFAAKYKSGGRYKTDGTNRFFESVDGSEDNIRIIPLYESGNDHAEGTKYSRSAEDYSKEEKVFLESIVDDISKELGSDVSISSIKKDAKTLLSDRITVSSDNIPIPILEEGFGICKDFMDDFITEDGNFCESGDEKKKEKDKKTSKNKSEDLEDVADRFINHYKMGEKKQTKEEGGFYQNNKKTDIYTESDIKDCYEKLIPPTRMLPVKIMGETMFYIYIQTTEAESLSTILSYTSQIREKDPSNKIDTLVDDIADRVVSKFNKKFVKDNIGFRKLIVSALEYYDMANTKIHFQLIQKQYVTEFKVNKDMDGNGHSMLEHSLFYAKLYLMIMLYRIFSILTKSNDEKITYIRTSGIDKNTWNKAQDIIRQKQSRCITLNDLFSYTSIINKVGAGTEIFMPMGKGNEKPLESEVIQGQDVQTNSDLTDSLRTSYILGTNVPSAIMNYLNEADFAKSIETANTKMNGRVINYQIDLNDPITEYYQKQLRFSTTMPEEVIKSIRVVLPEPKGTLNIATQEIINNYQTLLEFTIKLFMGDNTDDDILKQMFTKNLVRYHLPMLNMPKLEEIYKDTLLERQREDIAHPKEDNEITL